MSKKLRILQFPIANSYGGITRYALNNWYHMDKERFECDFATMSKHLDFAEDIEQTGAKVFYLSCYSTEDEQRFRQEFNAILDNGYDVVHLHTKQWKNFIVEEICKERNIRKVIVHSHSTQCDNNDPVLREKETLIHDGVKKRFTPDLATDFWACSSEAAEWLFGDQIPKEKIVIMKNAIDVERFIYNPAIRKNKREELGLSNDEIIIGSVGRLCYQKNHELLIRAYAGMLNEIRESAGTLQINTKLMIVGDGELRIELDDLIAELGISDNVIMLGQRNDTYELYQAMDLFALPSRFEGLPITLIEAQCSGLKCLVNGTISRESNVSENIIWVNDKKSWTSLLKDTIYDCIQHKQIVRSCDYLVSFPYYDRKDMSSAMKNKGYDLDSQIKYIESKYKKGGDIM